jgi:hypothetical protein
VELGDQAEVECAPQDAYIIGRSSGKRDIRLTEAGVEQEALRKDAAFSELVGEIISDGQGRSAISVVISDRGGRGFGSTRPEKFSCV